ncbi:hypothetical protein BDY17DRAFT_54630 [Neohortaea acidophila]|uniref:Uncharacterized protein n=1 Tax=Neohortaea acidophila TaxID=245834 RepID=A0A6A6PF53_9PEZI|nr:uncharacterized protein BDY17DRAFT_54630 [Neohortaea acidophila]KAF2478575.1 hypothetical protein BDY17DRAFT_54630 [Neohortaea acidophila]
MAKRTPFIETSGVHHPRDGISLLLALSLAPLRSLLPFWRPCRYQILYRDSISQPYSYWTRQDAYMYARNEVRHSRNEGDASILVPTHLLPLSSNDLATRQNLVTIQQSLHVQSFTPPLQPMTGSINRCARSAAQKCKPVGVLRVSPCFLS